jgi:hypothetical protein
MTARDELEAGLPVAVCRTSPRVTSETARRMAHTAWGTCDGRAVRAISLSAGLTFATPSDRVVEARSRLV